VVKVLVAFGADSTHRTPFGTALEVAQTNNHTAIVDILRQPPPRAVALPSANLPLPLPAPALPPPPSVASSTDNFSQRLRDVNRHLASYYQRPADANFFHALTRDQAESLLKTGHAAMVPGVFLLRSSSQVGAVALSYREGDGVGHSVLELLDNGWLRYQGQAYSLADYFSSVSHALTAPLSVADVEAMRNAPAPRYGAVGGVSPAAASAYGSIAAVLPANPGMVARLAVPAGLPVAAGIPADDDAYVRVVSPYTAQQAQELSCAVGEVLTVLRASSGWWEVKEGGATGVGAGSVCGVC
jgi:hypothetical protein